MKKIIIMLVCIMLFSGCQGSLSQIERFGTEYSSEEKYIAMLPNGISIPMTYDDVLGLKGESQYSSDDLPYSGELFYDETFLDRQCILGFSFENGKVKELAYIYECENETEKEKETKYIYKCLKNCYGNSNNELDSLNNYVPWKDMYLDDHIYATWKHTYIDNYTVELHTQSNSDFILCTIRFINNFAGILEETTAYSCTTTTAYDKPVDGMTLEQVQDLHWGILILNKCRDFDHLRVKNRYYEAKWFNSKGEKIGWGLIVYDSNDESDTRLVKFRDYTED